MMRACHETDRLESLEKIDDNLLCFRGISLFVIYGNFFKQSNDFSQ